MPSSISMRPSCGSRGPEYSRPQRLPRGVARGQRIGPPGAFFQHGLGEDDQRGHLIGMQCADLGVAKQRAVVAEQGAGGRIGVDDLVGLGIEQQGGLGQVIEGEGAQVAFANCRRRLRSELHVELRNLVIYLRILVYYEFSWWSIKPGTRGAD